MNAGEHTFGAAREQRGSGHLPASVTAAASTVKLQLAALLGLAGALNLWALGQNGWANTYYSAAVRSMSSSWHNFLFGAMDSAGAMTVDKPPLSLWVQALSVRVFGYHPLSMLVPQALMGMASVALVYDLVRRPFGKLGGFLAGLVLALTPIQVAVSRHNNPDELLVLCSVAALWCTVRALERRSPRWLVLAGVCVGLGFETKMAVALMVVPGIAAAWLWVAPNGRKRALGELLGAGGMMVLVGGAWPALVELTPASNRPWVSGTSGNSVWELITEYNGFGRLDGQTGGPGGAFAGNMFGGSSGPGRLLNAALGGQAGWLLGFALISALAVLIACRLRRADRRSGWLIAIGGAFLVTATVFSEAQGIFHPYYVSLLAPFAAALTGAGVAQLGRSGKSAPVLAAAAIAAAVACELIVLHQYPGQLTWLGPVLIVVGAMSAVLLLVLRERTLRTAALLGAVGVLLIAPGAWAFDTLGHAANGTFPEGGPQSLRRAGGPGGPMGAFRRGLSGRGVIPGGVPLFGSRGSGAGEGAGSPPVQGAGGGEGPAIQGGGEGPPTGVGRASATGAPGGFAGAGAGINKTGAPGGQLGGGLGGPVGGPLGNARTISQAIAYAKRHGGGTVAVASQSSAASAIVQHDADVAGIGGFSGRESDVSVSWLAAEVGKGKLRWVLGEGGQAGGMRLPDDTRQGSRKALAAVVQVCAKVSLQASVGESETGLASGEGGLYDCKGRSAALAAQESSR